MQQPLALAERECQRYYQAWLAAHGSSEAVARHLSTVGKLDLEQQGFKCLESRDHTLIAFAQNVALRMNARRCMISLIDSVHQYVLGEATRSHSSEHPDGATGDEIWLGTAILSRPDAICENCLDSQCEAPYGEEDTFAERNSPDSGDGRGRSGQEEVSKPTEDNVYTAEGMVVNDCRVDPRFADRPYVMQEEGARVRFYAGVPLITRNGYKIGVLAVTDENPREGLRAHELRYMQDMARCSMEHLEWAKDRVDRFKGERVVRGMASFIEDATLLTNPNDPRLTCGSLPTSTSSMQASTSSDRKRPALKKDRSFRRVYTRNGSTSSHETDDIFASATHTLREGTLADGCVAFGAVADTEMSVEKDQITSPMSRPSKTLAVSVDGSRATADSGAYTLTLGTLYTYYKAFPHGCVLSFNEESLVICSEEDETSDEHQSDDAGADAVNGSRKPHQKSPLNHEELLRNLTGARSIVFMPLFDPSEEKLIAGIFLWSRTASRLADVYLSHVRAFVNCVLSEVKRMDIQSNEAAKTSFIASISHELRSPLHGILGAAEFLIDNTNDAYNAGLVTSIRTCGKTLLDTLNHVLDHSKINKFGNSQKRHSSHKTGNDGSWESMNLTADVDLAVLVEEVAEAVTVGHTLKLPTSSANASSLSASLDRPMSQQRDNQSRDSQGLTVLLDIEARPNWMVTVQPGALHRVIMNLLGNAFQYTPSGSVVLSLQSPDDGREAEMSVLISIADSGIGISEAFQRDKLFVPFSQEDSFQPGTGLGLSIVKQVIESMDGSIDVKSKLGVGTQVDVKLKLTIAHDPVSGSQPASMPDESSKMAGKKLAFMERADSSAHQNSRFRQNLAEICEDWYGMQVSRSTDVRHDDGVDVYMYCETPTMAMLQRHKQDHLQRKKPVILACQNNQHAMSAMRDQQKFLSELGVIVEVIQQPCGPRKLRKTLMSCLKKAEELDIDAALGRISVSEDGDHLRNPQIRTPASSAPMPTCMSRPDDSTSKQELCKTVMPAIEVEVPPAVDCHSISPGTVESQDAPSKQLEGPATLERKDTKGPPGTPSKVTEQVPQPKGLRLLLVDDNSINRQLLVTFMKKCKFTYEQAENGQEALDLFTSTTDASAAPFDYILMDISMPVMDGFEATRRIRGLEENLELGRTKIFALTGLASEKAREEAETVGVDLFLPKPVKFAELKKLLVA